jgi:hypothetical protein
LVLGRRRPRDDGLPPQLPHPPPPEEKVQSKPTLPHSNPQLAVVRLDRRGPSAIRVRRYRLLSLIKYHPHFSFPLLSSLRPPLSVFPPAACLPPRRSLLRRSPEHRRGRFLLRLGPEAYAGSAVHAAAEFGSHFRTLGTRRIGAGGGRGSERAGTPVAAAAGECGSPCEEVSGLEAAAI